MHKPRPPVNVKAGEFPFSLTSGPDESRYLTWVRNHSNYMAERGEATLIRYARIDLGIQIHINLAELGLANQKSKVHHAIGSIRYPGDETGYLLYLKSSFTGDEDAVITEYRHRNPEFPHESTADQFFDEGQFEAYRAWGQHIAETALGSADRFVSGEEKISLAKLENWLAASAPETDSRA